MIVLSYIRNEDRYKTFVANRISKIRSVSKPNQWIHVRTGDNPADEGSRGTRCISKWLTGTEFLTKQESFWPEPKFHDSSITEDSEVKSFVVRHSNKNQPQEYCHKGEEPFMVT